MHVQQGQKLRQLRQRRSRAGLTDLQRQFQANRSMRDVEPNVDLFVKNLNDWPQSPSTRVVSRKYG
jgi:hypothetical protein